MREHASRKFAYHWRPHIPKLSQVVGEVTLAMNLLQSTLGGILWALLNPRKAPLVDSLEELNAWDPYPVPPEQVFAVWNAIASDAAQRDMMLAAAEAILSNEPAMLRRIAWIKRKADSLGKARNDAAHLVVDFQWETETMQDAGRLVPHPFAMPRKRVNRLTTAKTLESRFKYVTGDIIALQTYALGVIYKLHSPRSALPKRPKLRSAPDQD